MGITPIMADHEVADDDMTAEGVPRGGPTPRPAEDSTTSPAGPANGRPVVGSHVCGDGLTLLRSEFSRRIESVWERFRTTEEELQDAAAAMRNDGRPPTYRLIHSLGECHREFLRLRLDLARRAESLSVTLPALDTLGGIGDLVRFIESRSGGERAGGLPDRRWARTSPRPSPGRSTSRHR